MLSLVPVDIVTWGIVHCVVRSLVVNNLVRDNIMVTNLLMMGQNIMMYETWFVCIHFMMYLILYNMSCHVSLIKLLGDLNVSGVMILNLFMDYWLVNGLMVHWLMNGFVMDWHMNGFVMDWLVSDFVVDRSLVMSWLDLNVSNLWLDVSVLWNLNVAFMGWLMGSVDWFVSLLNIAGLLISVIALSAVLVWCNLWLVNIVCIILRFSASLDRDNGGNNESKSVHYNFLSLIIII